MMAVINNDNANIKIVLNNPIAMLHKAIKNPKTIINNDAPIIFLMFFFNHFPPPQYSIFISLEFSAEMPFYLS